MCIYIYIYMCVCVCIGVHSCGTMYSPGHSGFPSKYIDVHILSNAQATHLPRSVGLSISAKF